MLQTKQILVSAIVLVASAAALTACGQPGVLYLPTDPAAAGRASLPQSMIPGAPAEAATALPPKPPASAPTSK